MVRKSLWLLLVVLGASVADDVRETIEDKDRIIRVEWRHERPYTNKEDLFGIKVEEEIKPWPETEKQWKKSPTKVKTWGKAGEKSGGKYLGGDKYLGRVKRSHFLTAPILPALVAPHQAEYVQEAQRVANEQLSQVVDLNERAKLKHRQLAIDTAVHIQDGQWVSELQAREIERRGQQIEEVQQEVVRAVGDQLSQVADQQHVAQLGHQQLSKDVRTAAENSKWVANLASETVERAVQQQGEIQQEVVRAAEDQQAQVKDSAERTGLDIAGQIEDGRWVGQLAKEATETEVQRQGEIVQEIGRQVGEQQAQLTDRIENGRLAVAANVEEGKWVGQLVDEAVQTEAQRLLTAQQEHARQLHELQAGAVVHHLLKKRDVREKRSDWVSQLGLERLQQVGQEAGRLVNEHNLQATDILRRQVQREGEIIQEYGRQVGEQHTQINDQVRRANIDLVQHVNDGRWVGQLVNEAVQTEVQRQADNQREGIRQLHDVLTSGHLLKKRETRAKRSNWVAHLQLDCLNQAQVEAARQVNELNRHSLDVATQQALRLGEAQVEAARQVGEHNRQALDLAARQADAVRVNVESKQWVGPWLNDVVAQQALRGIEAQTEYARRVNQLHGGLALHHLKKRSNWVAQLQLDRLNQAQVEAVRQVGEHNRQAVDTLNRQIDAANVQVQSSQWVGPWLNDAVAQQAQRQVEAQVEYARRVNELAVHHLKKRSTPWVAQLHHDRLNQAQVEAVRQVSEHNRQAVDAVNRQIDAANVHVLSKQWVGPWVHDATALQAQRAIEAQAEGARQVGELNRQVVYAAQRQADAARVSVQSKQWVGPWVHDAAALQAQRAVEAQAEGARQVGELNRQVIDAAQRQADAARVSVVSKQWVGPWVHDAAALQAQRVAEAQAESVRQAAELNRRLATAHHLKKRDLREKRSNWVGQLIQENGERAIQGHVEANQEVTRVVTEQQAQLKDHLERGGLALAAHVEDGRWVGHLVNEAGQREVQRQGEVVAELGKQIGDNTAQLKDGLERGALDLEARVEDTKWVGQLVHEAGAREVQRQGEVIQEWGRQVGEVLPLVHVLHKRSPTSWQAQLHNERAQQVALEGARIVGEHVMRAKDQHQVAALGAAAHAESGRWVGQLWHEMGARRVQSLAEVQQEHARRAASLWGHHLGKRSNWANQLHVENAQTAVREYGRVVKDSQDLLKDQLERNNLAVQAHLGSGRWVGQLAQEIGARQVQKQGEIVQEVTRVVGEQNMQLRDAAGRARLAAEGHVRNVHWVGQLGQELGARQRQAVGELGQEHQRQVVELNRQVSEAATAAAAHLGRKKRSLLGLAELQRQALEQQRRANEIVALSSDAVIRSVAETGRQAADQAS